MAESQDVNTLRRRGRRRLVGAIALVLLAAIVLPMVFDPEPRPGGPPVSVRIPGEDDASFAPKVQAPAVVAAPAPPAASPPEAAPTTRKAEAQPDAAASTPEPPKPAGKAAAATATAPAASAPATEQFVVPVAALASQAKVKEMLGKLTAARLPHYTEPVATAKGTVTRVRVGPYATREAAEEAQRQLKRLGLAPGNVLGKS